MKNKLSFYKQLSIAALAIALLGCEGNGPFNQDPCDNYEMPEAPNWHRFLFCIVRPTSITPEGTQLYADRIVGSGNSLSDLYPYTVDSVRLYAENGIERPLFWTNGGGYAGGGSWQTNQDTFIEAENVLNHLNEEQDTTFYLFLNASDTDTLHIRYKIVKDECNSYVYEYLNFYHNGNVMPGYMPSSEIHYIFFVKP
jgi:hypothetical protein